jgi:hypothetical protein
MPDLRAFSNPLDINSLATVIALPEEKVISSDDVAGHRVELLSDVPDSIDLDELSSNLAEATKAVLRPNTRESDSDATVVQLIHEPLRDLPREAASKAGFWTWLACGYGRSYVWCRWVDDAPPGTERDDIASQISEGERAPRFSMRSPGLYGVSRHGLARLWWLADSLQGDYELASKILDNQDIFQAIYERRVGLVPSLPAILADEFNLGDPDRRPSGAEFRAKVMTTLNQLATVTRLETLDEEELRELVAQVRVERLPEFG